MNTETLLIVSGLLATLVIGTLLAILFRRVVETNEVHIVQTSRSTTSYGKNTQNGNTYYEWPSWIPVIGVTKIVLPVSVFNINLDAYEAYDKDRVPFMVDVVAFFRISDSNLAAERVSSFAELNTQLRSIVQGAVRTILASDNIDNIMLQRSTFGQKFTQEVESQLANWGVETVKNLELMDIRDSRDSKVIHNIMQKKQSAIEMESRKEVAKNQKEAQQAEIEANRDVLLKDQEAKQSVGLRTVEQERAVEVATQEAEQAVKEQERITKEKEMAVVKVNDVKRAEINQEMAIVKAEEVKQQTIRVAEGNLHAKKLEAEGITAEGQARAEAEKAMQLAPVEAQIVLAKEIGENQSYQEYLVTIRRVEAQQAVGIEQAKALEKADVKIITNAGDPVSGVEKTLDLFTPKGGNLMGGALEALIQSPTGQELVRKFTKGGSGGSGKDKTASS